LFVLKNCERETLKKILITANVHPPPTLLNFPPS